MKVVYHERFTEVYCQDPAAAAGRMLTTEDYWTIGKLIKEFAEGVCQGKRYGVLEGGYNHQLLGRNVKSLLDGLA